MAPTDADIGMALARARRRLFPRDDWSYLESGDLVRLLVFCPLTLVMEFAAGRPGDCSLFVTGAWFLAGDLVDPKLRIECPHCLTGHRLVSFRRATAGGNSRLLTLHDDVAVVCSVGTDNDMDSVGELLLTWSDAELLLDTNGITARGLQVQRIQAETAAARPEPENVVSIGEWRGRQKA